MNILSEVLHPINSRFAFIDADINSIVNEFIEWQKPIVANAGNDLVVSDVNLDLESCLRSLCPLTVGEIRKYLFIPTKNNWVMFLDNSHLGTDRTAPEVMCEFLKTKMIYVTISPLGNLFELYESGKLVRLVGVSKESTWKFYEIGNLLDFEDVVSYKKRVIKDRLTPENVIHYLRYFNIDILNEEYLKFKSSRLIAKKGKMFKSTKELSLIEAQSFFK